MHADIWPPLLLSLKVALSSTLLNLFLATCCAWWLSRSRSMWTELADAVLTLPLVMPPTVLGYYLLVLLGRRGWIGAWLDHFGISLIFTVQGAIIAATIVAFPLVLRSARTAFEEIDGELEAAAKMSGMTPVARFLRISLPLARRGIMAGLILGFVRALGEFGATIMVAGSLPGRTQTLSVAIYQAVQAGDDETANLLVLITSVTCIVALILASILLPRRRLRLQGVP